MENTIARAKTRVTLRWMIRRDLPEVLDIEQTCFEFPWAESDFIRCMRQRSCIGYVAEWRDDIVGMMMVELLADGLRILNFGVHPLWHRAGVGTQMIDRLKAKLQSRRVFLTCEVRETNTDAQIFFREMGFKATKVMRDFYDDSSEDAYLFEHRK